MEVTPLTLEGKHVRLEPMRLEGTLRNHIIMADGRLRRSSYFSVIESEWLAVRSRLEDMLATR